MLKARFLGTPRIQFGADAQDIPLTGRILALFVYLSVTRQSHSRSKLADLLWDHQMEQNAKTNLRYLLRDLRKTVGDYLLVDGQTIAFNHELAHWLDVTSFTIALSPDRSASPTQIDPAILQESLNLYAGDFLAGFHIQDASNFESWMLAQRRHYHDLMVYGVQLVTQQHLDAGNFEAGLALNRYLLTLEPWREEAHRQRMILLAASGQRSAALMQYELCCKILEEELDVPPMNETTSLYTQIKSGMWFLDQKIADNYNQQRIAVRAFPQTTQPFTNAQPIPSTSAKPTTAGIQVDLGAMPSTKQFIGRRKELAALQRWLSDGSCRLITICGLGGEGKSALAARFVQEQLQSVALMSNAPDDRGAPYDDRAETQPQLGLYPGRTNERNSLYMHNWPLPTTEHQPSTATATDGTADNIGDGTANGIVHIIWRSLEQRPSCIDILQDWIRRLSQQPHKDLPTSFDQLITLLFSLLEQKRCLLVLDGLEAVLQQTGTYAPTERAHYAVQIEIDAFERLFRLFVERQHRSCLLLTSRIRPSTWTSLQKHNQAVHILELKGLSGEDCEEFLTMHGLAPNPNNYQSLLQQYAGNPLLLSQVADLVHDLFDGDMAAFRQEELYFLGDMGGTLTEQLAYLSPLELHIMHALTGIDQPLRRQSLWESLSMPTTKQEFYQALQRLQRAYFILQEDGRYKLAPLLAAYLVERGREE